MSRRAKSGFVWETSGSTCVPVDFEHSFNILTGETGAGKSILVEAVGLLERVLDSRENERMVVGDQHSHDGHRLVQKSAEGILRS